MKHLVQKAMISLACAIIMLHAVVPHHHHDSCDAKGLVFENEVACHCDYDHHDADHRSHHPFNICLLQEMLSHLVFSTCDDHLSSTAIINADSNSFVVLAVPCSQLEHKAPFLLIHLVWWPSGTVPLYKVPLPGTVGLRAPPAVA